MVPERLTKRCGRYSLVDGIRFKLPRDCVQPRVISAAFSVDAAKAQALLPGNDIVALHWRGKGLLLLNAIKYQGTTIGKYIEFSVGIACSHISGGKQLAPTAWLAGKLDFGQYVLELPVSTEISAKSGRGVWGMPKSQASLSFEIEDKTARAQYEVDSLPAMALKIDRRHLECLFPFSWDAAKIDAFFRGGGSRFEALRRGTASEWRSPARVGPARAQYRRRSGPDRLDASGQGCARRSLRNLIPEP